MNLITIRMKDGTKLLVSASLSFSDLHALGQALKNDPKVESFFGVGPHEEVRLYTSVEDITTLVSLYEPRINPPQPKKWGLFDRDDKQLDIFEDEAEAEKALDKFALLPRGAGAYLKRV